MLKAHYPELFAGDPNWRARADAFAEKTYELVSFLVDVLKVERVDAHFAGTVTYHDSCSGLRELGVHAQPRRLLGTVQGLRLVEMHDAERLLRLRRHVLRQVSRHFQRHRREEGRAMSRRPAHDTLLAGDLGCLMNMAGKLQREGKEIDVRHVAEVLAGMTAAPAIGGRHEDTEAAA